MVRSYRTSGSDDKAFTVRVSKRVYDQATMAADLTGRSLSALTEAALVAYLTSPTVVKAAKDRRESYIETINQLAGGST